MAKKYSPILRNTETYYDLDRIPDNADPNNVKGYSDFYNDTDGEDRTKIDPSQTAVEQVISSITSNKEFGNTLDSLRTMSGSMGTSKFLDEIAAAQQYKEVGIPYRNSSTAQETFAPSEVPKRDSFIDLRDEMAGQKREVSPININNVNQEHLDSTAKQTILAFNQKNSLQFKSDNIAELVKNNPVQSPAPSMGAFRQLDQGPVANEDQESQAISMGKFRSMNPSVNADDSQKGFLSNNAMAGASGLSNSIMRTLDWILPNELMGKYDFLEPVFNYYQKSDQQYQKEAQKTNDTKVKEVAGQLINGTVQAIPSALLAVASGGMSLAGSGLEAATGIANATKINKIGKALQTATKELGGNPMFWTSFAQMAGPTYDQEIQNGASPAKASASALLNGILGSAIEVGGGLETFKWSDKGWPSILKTALEEGGEEISQYSVQNLINKAVGSNTAKWFSADKNTDAVINPLAQAEQGAYGAAIGGILGGGQQLAVTLIVAKGVSITSIVDNICVIIQALFLFAAIICAIRLVFVSPELSVNGTGIFNAAEWPKVGVGGIVGGASVLALSFLGFDSVTTLAEETHNPEKTIGNALVIICLVAGGVFILASLFFQLAWPNGWSEIQNPDTGAFELLGYVGGTFLSSLFCAIAVFGCGASAIASMTSAARILYGMGRDEILPKKFFGHVNKKTQTPDYNTYLVGAVSLVVALIVNLEIGTSLINFGALLGFALVNISVITYYFGKKKERGGKAVFTYLILPILGACVCLYIWINLDAKSLILGFSWLFIGFIYLAIRTKGFKNLPPTIAGMSE